MADVFWGLSIQIEQDEVEKATHHKNMVDLIKRLLVSWLKFVICPRLTFAGHKSASAIPSHLAKERFDYDLMVQVGVIQDKNSFLKKVVRVNTKDS